MERAELFDFSGAYRFQSVSVAEPAQLKGKLVESGRHLNSDAVNAHLTDQADWDGRSRACLRVIEVEHRGGAFARYDDALYYGRNFQTDRLPFDLLDVGKLRELAERRLPKLATILSPAAMAETEAALEGAVDEYMCHEAGHRLGYSIEDKLRDGFFHRGGRLSWPLVYLEEFRADLLSWRVALSLLDGKRAARVVLYTLTHRLGLALENMREGRSGAGFIPYLEFAAMADRGFLEISRSGTSARINTPAGCGFVLDAAEQVVRDFGAFVGRVDSRRHGDAAAEAMLRHALYWQERADLVSCFREVMLGAALESRPVAEGSGSGV